jgi:formylmethanofuran dehydrogenase subunit E
MNMETLDYARRFHGHLGPFLVIGLRMGSLAGERLGNPDPVHSLECLVELENKRPVSCVIDGIQVSSGCTLGKGNIHLRDGRGISALFQSSGRSLRVSVRGDALERVLGIMKQGGDRVAAEVMRMGDEELFEVDDYGKGQ